MEKREKFASRLGFLLISAGCAIGIGNVWRFPYITGQYGGAAFVLIYLFFLVVLGLPIMAMEFAVGRASRKSCAVSFRVLEPAGTKWHWYAWLGMAGNYLLMMFYTTVAGWMLAYVVKMLRGAFTGASAEAVGGIFNDMLAQPGPQIFWMIVAVVLGFGVCSLGLQNGVEKITKAMMVCLLLLMVALAVRSVTLPGAGEGLKFYLVPDFGRLVEQGVGNVVYAAMGQAFFSLSITGSGMIIYGSYLSKSENIIHSSCMTAVLDTCAALLAGLAIIPAVFAFQMDPASGPPLMFITLPKVFSQIPFGNIIGGLFFLSVLFAGITSLMNMFEVCAEALQKTFRIRRKLSILITGTIIFIIGLFIENEKYLGSWMDVITIYVVPFGALLGAFMIYWILDKKKIHGELNTGAPKPVGKFFTITSKYIYVFLAVIVFILGIIYGGIG